MRRALPFLVVVLALAGCGRATDRGGLSAGADGLVAAPGSIANHGTATVRGRRLVVRMAEDYFRPSVIRAPAGSTVELVVENVGVVAHAFDVSELGQKIDVIVQPGKRATVHVRVPRVGRLLFFCKFHWSKGMAGYLEPTGP